MDEAVPLAELAPLIPAAALCALRELLPGDRRAQPLAGGRGVNLCVRVDNDSGRRVVLRIRRGGPVAGADFRRELESQRLAAHAGLAPAVLAADDAGGWLLMDHVDAPAWEPARLRERGNLWRLGERLRRLHALAPPAFAPVDALHLLHAHCDALAARGRAPAPDGLRRAGELTARLALLPPRPAVLCHGDPDVGNLLGHEPMLVDFEYAQVADPVYDAALLLAYYPFLEADTATVLAAMGLDDPASARRLPLQLELCRIVNDAWTRAGRLD